MAEGQMDRWAFVFPGQGAQKVGMGKDLYEQSSLAREVFQGASDALAMDMAALCFEGPEETLRLTENTQPAILTVSIAAWRVFQQETDLQPAILAGHSLGEYAALVVSGALTFKDAVYAVKQRGRFMQEAVPVGVGSMAAILGLEDEIVREACDAAAEGQVVEPANFNSAGQVVISGHREAVERASVIAREKGAKKAVPLPVSAPFHSSLMVPAGKRLEEVLKTMTIGKLETPVIANVTGSPYPSEMDVVPLLVEQVSSPVFWKQSMEMMRASGVTRVVELGPGKVLSGLFRRFDRGIPAVSLQTHGDIIKFQEGLSA